MATTERVLLCFSAQPTAQAVIRSAARLATALRAELYALHVASPGDNTRRSPEAADQLDRNQRLARDLGAQVTLVYNHRVAEAVLAFAHEHEVSRIVLGASRHAGWRRRLGGDLARQLAARAPRIAIQVVER